MMKLWTIQTEDIYGIMQKDGVCRCDVEKSIFYNCSLQEYDWMAEQMRKRIGPSPDGVNYPVWAWYLLDGLHKNPDLRRERWANGWKGDRFVCMELEVPQPIPGLLFGICRSNAGDL